MTAFKAQAMIRDLQERLQGLLPAAATYATAYDSNFNPTIAITNAGETVYINIQPIANQGRVDSVGNSQQSYSPHVVTLLELTTVTDLNTRNIALNAATWLGSQTNVWTNTAFGAPVTFTITPPNGQPTPNGTAPVLVSTIYPDPYNAVTNQM